MITISALIIWIVWQFGSNTRQRLAAGIAAVLVVLCVVSVNFLLAKSYGPHTAVRGSYFLETAPLTNQLALHVCGLAFGTTWNGCPKRIEEEGNQLPASEAARAHLLFSMAWQNFNDHPDVLTRRLISASSSFVYNLTDQLFRGYGHLVVEPSINIRTLLAGLPGRADFFVFEAARERRFTILVVFLAKYLASTSLIYFDDGDRALAVSYVIIFLFSALGFANPTAGGPLQ